MSNSYNFNQEDPSLPGLNSPSNSSWAPSPPSQSSSQLPNSLAQEPARPSFIEQLGLQFALDEEQVSILYAAHEVCLLLFLPFSPL